MTDIVAQHAATFKGPPADHINDERLRASDGRGPSLSAARQVDDHAGDG
jgi:hypothetical protein